MNFTYDILAIDAALGSRYALTGDIAAALHGEVFAVDTVEVLVDDTVKPDEFELDPAKLPALLSAPAFWFSLRKNSPLVNEAFAKATTIELDGRPIRIVTPEYLVAMELTTIQPLPAERVMDLRFLARFSPTVFSDIRRRYPSVGDALDRYHQIHTEDKPWRKA